ncbi:ATP-binding cassette domain-containing protein, partial [Thermodesulfobacteriota bacterium]
SRPVLFSESHLQRLRKAVVMVDQHPILFTNTVYKNLEFGLKIRRIPPQKRGKIIEESLDLVGMRRFAGASAHRLSGGETQRVAIARALAVSPEVLLCDEPTSSVDVENQAAIINILRRINDLKKITVMFTTHDRFQVASLAQHTLFLDNGKLVPGAHENLFTAVLSKKGENVALCEIQNNVRLTIPTDREGRVRVFIDPEKVFLGKDHLQNAQKGRVVQVMEENQHVRLVVNLGVWITLFMSQEVYANKRPAVGETVQMIIPPEAVKIL